MGEFTIHPLVLNISTGLFYVLQTLKSGSTFHLTLFFLHLHHLTLPLIKGGDVLGVFAAHAGICVWGNRGAPVLPEIMRKKMRAGTHPEENSSRSVWDAHLLFQHVRCVGLQMLCAGTGWRTQRRVSVGFSSCGVNIGRVLQNNWRTAARTKKKPRQSSAFIVSQRHINTFKWTKSSM